MTARSWRSRRRSSEEKPPPGRSNGSRPSWPRPSARSSTTARRPTAEADSSGCSWAWATCPTGRWGRTPTAWRSRWPAAISSGSTPARARPALEALTDRDLERAAGAIFDPGRPRPARSPGSARPRHLEALADICHRRAHADRKTKDFRESSTQRQRGHATEEDRSRSCSIRPHSAGGPITLPCRTRETGKFLRPLCDLSGSVVKKPGESPLRIDAVPRVADVGGRRSWARWPIPPWASSALSPATRLIRITPDPTVRHPHRMGSAP